MQNDPDPENLAAAQQVLTILDHGTNPVADADIGAIVRMAIMSIANA